MESELGMELTASPVNRNLRYLFYFILVSIGAYFISTLFLFYTKLKLVDHLPANSSKMDLPAQKPVEKLPIDHYKIIWERNLFAAKADEERAAEPKDLLSRIDALSLTSLNCTLIGTIISETGESWAVIHDNQTNRQDRYTIGSTVSGAKVVMVLRNKVILNIDGRDELLVMGIEKIRSAKPDGEKSDISGAPEKEPSKISKAASKGDAMNNTLSRELIRDNISNMAQMMSKVRVVPFIRDGQPEGFRVSQIKDDSIFKSMGLQNGDVIKSINGQDILSAEDMMRAYSTLKDSSSFSISIMRGNQPKTLNVRVR